VGRKPSAKETDWYKQVLDRLDGIIDAAKPGASTADLAVNFPPSSTWGYKDEAEVLTMEIGHGIGLYGYELPVINRQWSLKHPQILEAGMTFAVESREGREGEGGVRLENMVVVTETGAEVMDHFPRDEILTAPA
jgi:Xaa-Pro aminopeptidase